MTRSNYDVQQEAENPHVRSRSEVFSEATRTAGQEYNAAMAAIDAERKECSLAIEELTEAVTSTASKGSAKSFAKRAESVRLRLLEADIQELRTLATQPKIRAAFYDEAMAEKARVEEEHAVARAALIDKLVSAGLSFTNAEAQADKTEAMAQFRTAAGLWDDRAGPFKPLYWSGKPSGAAGEKFAARLAGMKAWIAAQILGPGHQGADGETLKLKIVE